MSDRSSVTGHRVLGSQGITVSLPTAGLVRRRSRLSVAGKRGTVGSSLVQFALHTANLVGPPDWSNLDMKRGCYRKDPRAWVLALVAINGESHMETLFSS